MSLAIAECSSCGRVKAIAARAHDLDRLDRQVRSHGILSFRLILDRSIASIEPKFVGLVQTLFGRDSVRATRTHAKFATISNDSWAVTIRTSMNLNCNARLEYMQVAEDRGLTDFWVSIVDSIFANTAGGFEGDWRTPNLAEMADAESPRPEAYGDADLAAMIKALGG